MARILRSQGIYYLEKPQVVLVPSVQQQQQTIRTQFAVQSRLQRQRETGPGIDLRCAWQTFTTGQFPSLPVLDFFNRPDAATLGADWTDGVQSGDAGMKIDLNHCRGNSAGFSSAYWNSLQVRDAGVAVQLIDFVDIVYLVARLTSPGTAGASFVWASFNKTGSTIAIGYNNPGFVSLTSVGAAISNGDKIGFTAEGTKLTAYLNGVPVLTTVDATVSASGFIGFSGQGSGGSGWVGNDFGGGPIPALRTNYRWIGPRPPVVIQQAITPPTQEQVTPRVRLTDRDHDRTRRAPHFKLRPPTVVTPFSAFAAEPFSVELVQTRPRRTTKQLRPPTVLQVFAGPATRLVKTRPRLTLWDVRPPQVIRVPSVEQRQQTIQARLVRGRRPETVTRLLPPTVVRVPSVEQQEQTIRVRLVLGRRPETVTCLFPAVVVRVPSVLQQQQTIRTRLVQTRPRPTSRRLSPPTVVTQAAGETFRGPRTALTRTPRSRTAYSLTRTPFVERGPIHLTINILEVRIRPPATYARLNPPPFVIRVPSVELKQQTIRVRLVQTRPRHTIWALRPPRVIRVPSVEQQQQTLRVRLVRTRPRHTTDRLRPPAVVAPAVTPFIAYPLRVEVVRTRPRPTRKVLRPPVVVRVPSVEQDQRTLRKRLVVTRPRHTTTVLRPVGIAKTIGPPALRSLTRIRPRHTIAVLRPPTVLRVFETGAAVLTRIRPRHTIWQLRPPAVVAPFVAAVETTLHRLLVRIRPPQTRSHKPPPPFTPTVPGHACLTDHAAFEGCLTDQPAALACLTDQAGTAGCLTDQAGTEGCLLDVSAATATLRDED